MTLFRREAMAGRGQALEGTVSLAVPLSWQIVGGLLFTTVAAAVLFLVVTTTNRIVMLEATITDTGGARAILPLADAMLLPPGACGTLVLRGRSEGIPACLAARDTAAPRASFDGTVVNAHIATLRLATPAPLGARGTARFAIGRESLWASLTR